jgi:hypothetical protein
MKPKLLPTIISAISLLMAPWSQASNYQGQVSATYGEINLDDSPADISDSGLQGNFYFAPVTTTNRPFAEAAFLQKASGVYANGSYLKYRENDSEFPSSEKGYAYGRQIGADFYVPNSVFFLGAGINETKYKYESTEDGVTERDSMDWESQWYIKAGVTPIDGLLVWSEFYEDVDVSDAWNINAKYVMPIGVGNQWLNLEASYADADSSTGNTKTLKLAGDYYVDAQLSIGGGLTHYAYDENDYDRNENEYFIRASQFFTDKFSMNVSYADGDYESRWSIGASLRF